MTGRYEARRFFVEHLHDDTDACIIWPYAVGSHGYGELRVEGRPVSVHVLACIEHHGPRPEGMEAAHTCGPNPRCFNGRHLTWKTVAENQADRYRDGTDQRGSRNAQARLTEDQVLIIRRLVAGGWSRARAARQYGVSSATVEDIISGRTWGWLEEPLPGGAT